MNDSELYAAFADYDRIAPLRTGDVLPHGFHWQIACLEPSDIFARMCSNLEFDIAEMSMGAHLFATGAGDSAWIAVPAFPSRAYRHSMVYARADRGINTAQNLNGKTIVIREWGMTALIWIIGILADEYDFDMRSVDWVAARPPRVPLQLPQGVRLRYLSEGETISSVLEQGAVDAALYHEELDCFTRQPDLIKRVFANYAQAEMEYQQRTSMHPIMHCVVFRRELQARMPQLSDELFDVLERARQHAKTQLLKTGTLASMIPFLPQILEQTQASFGTDWWPYGLEANYACLQTLSGYAHAQGLTPELLRPEQLFT